LGKFDYIICNGVYSWVPRDVREKILQICCDNLADNGVAMVAYSTYPGWRMRSMIREMMRYHTRHVADPEQRVKRAREVIEFIAPSIAQGIKTIRPLLKKSWASCGMHRITRYFMSTWRM